MSCKNILIFSVIAVILCPGCASGLFKSSEEVIVPVRKGEKEKAFFIGDIATPYGLEWLEINSVSLVVNLAGTGSDPAPSQLRTALLREMNSQQVEAPNQILADKNTSLVLVSGFLPPGLQKGEHFDINVSIPPESETTSLRGGYLLKAPMRGMIMADRLRDGHKQGVCSGPIFVEPLTGDIQRDRETQKRGIVFSGGIYTDKSRNLGLRVSPDISKKDPYIGVQLENLINRRFPMLGKNNLRDNMAHALDDKHVELKVHMLYRHNLDRYLQVVRCIPLGETESQRLERLKRLEVQLNDPLTSRRAALELEAIGKAGIETLKTGLNNTSPVVQFYAAEALAYLDQNESASVLGRIALMDSGFRHNALVALGALDSLYAYEELRKLLSAPQAETRYGAFRALANMRPDDVLVKGQILGQDTFMLHVVPTTETPMLHVTKSRRAEIVLFGSDQRLSKPISIQGTNNLVLTTPNPGEVSIAKFTPNLPDQKRVVSTRIEDIIRALSDLGATYPDVLEILLNASAQGALGTSFKVDALPRGGRLSPLEEKEHKASMKAQKKLGNKNSESKKEKESEVGENHHDKDPKSEDPFMAVEDAGRTQRDVL